jgi:uncharacterized Zn finger protein
MLHLCPQCLEKTVYQETGHVDERKFDLYRCPNCGSYNREWFTLQDRVALVRESHSANAWKVREFEY